MAFLSLPVFVRNDPLGPTSHNTLLQRQDTLYYHLSTEHDPSNGEHNTPHVARTLGHVAWNGANYSIASGGFNTYLNTVANPAVGTITLNLRASGKFSVEYSVVEIQPADNTGGADGFPWLASAKWTDSQTMQVFLKRNTAAIDTQQAFAAADGDFFIGLRAPTRAISTARSTAPNRRRRGEGLRVSASDWNRFVQDQGDHRRYSLVAHTSAGLHNTREVSKAWGYARWDSGNSRYTWGAHQGLGAGVVRQSTGHVRVFVANCVPAIASPVQAFARAVSETTGTNHTGLRIAHVPHGACGTSTVDVYLYESYVSGTEYRWRRVDGDFYVRIHGA